MTSARHHYILPGLAVTEHTFDVPLDHSDPSGESITIFALELVDPAKSHQDLPWLVFFQGGPGGQSPRPSNGSAAWFGRALRTHRVLLIDQRGTGRSTPLTWREASRLSPDDLARRIAFLRTDSIVDDAEVIRSHLSPDRPWETLGQSYGGWITMSYLSRAPQGLRACYIGGGLPGLNTTIFELNSRTLQRVEKKVRDFYERFPQDRDTVQRLRDKLIDNNVVLPNGDVLTVDRMRQVGRFLGMGNGIAKLHWLLNDAIRPDGSLSDLFLTGVMEPTLYSRNPLHPVLIDFTYPHTGEPTNWAADRAIAQNPAFAIDAETMLLTGEFAFRWIFYDIARQRPFAPAMEILHQRTDWAPIWEPDKLLKNRVPVAAAIYQEDMYVDADFSLTTSAAVPNVRHWITNEYQHDGLAASGGGVLDRLMTMTTEIG